MGELLFRFAPCAGKKYAVKNTGSEDDSAA